MSSEPLRDRGTMCSTENESAEYLSWLRQYSQQYAARSATASRSSAELAILDYGRRDDPQLIEQFRQGRISQAGELGQSFHSTSVEILNAVGKRLQLLELFVAEYAASSAIDQRVISVPFYLGKSLIDLFHEPRLFDIKPRCGLVLLREVITHRLDHVFIRSYSPFGRFLKQTRFQVCGDING